MTPQHHLPADIERTSMGIITAELAARGLAIPPENAAVVKRVIHTTADFDYAENLRFTPGAAAAGVAAMRAGAVVITDTNMALAGITKPGLAKIGRAGTLLYGRPRCRRCCEGGGLDPGRRRHAQGRAGVPRRGAGRWQRPTALLTIADEIESGLRPTLVIAVPRRLCERGGKQGAAVCGLHAVRRAPPSPPWGRKGGSNVAAAICNALGVFRRRDARPCGKRLAVIHFLPQVFPYNRKFWRGGGVLPPPLFCFPIKSVSASPASCCGSFCL